MSQTCRTRPPIAPPNCKGAALAEGELFPQPILSQIWPSLACPRRCATFSTRAPWYRPTSSPHTTSPNRTYRRLTGVGERSRTLAYSANVFVEGRQQPSHQSLGPPPRPTPPRPTVPIGISLVGVGVLTRWLIMRMLTWKGDSNHHDQSLGQPPRPTPRRPTVPIGISLVTGRRVRGHVSTIWFGTCFRFAAHG